MSADGYVTITGRIKDLIIRGGENIHPLEIENCLFAHPDVSNVSVVGVPDVKYGEVVTAFIVPRESGKDLAGVDEVKNWVRERLSHHLGEFIRLLSFLLPIQPRMEWDALLPRFMTSSITPSAAKSPPDSQPIWYSAGEEQSWSLSCVVLPSFPSHRRSSLFHIPHGRNRTSHPDFSPAAVLHKHFTPQSFSFCLVFVSSVVFEILRIPYRFPLFLHRQKCPTQNGKDITSTQKRQLLHPTLDVHIMLSATLRFFITTVRKRHRLTPQPPVNYLSFFLLARSCISHHYRRLFSLLLLRASNT